MVKRETRFDPVVLPRLALIVPMLVLLSTTVADPDLWGHVRFGGDILAARALPADAYAFTSDRPWVNHEWLAETIFAAAYGAAGAAGLIVLRLALLGATLLLAARALRGRGVGPLARDVLVAFLVIGTHPTFHTVRPQLFSLLAFAWLLSRMAAYDEHARGGWRALALAPVVLALWANLHGGWLVGIGALAVWGMATVTTAAMATAMATTKASTFSTATPPIGARIRPAGPLVILLLATAGATAINPYGVGLWRFMAETVSFTRADITEWQPLFRSTPVEIGLWVGACVLGVWAVIHRADATRPRPGAIAVLALLALASFRVRRLEPFFVLSAVMIAGPALARGRAPRASTSAGADPPPSDRVAPPRASAARRPSLALTMALALVLVDGAMRPSGRFGCIDSSDARLPDAEVSAFLRGTASVRGRMLTWSDWGEYAIWHLAPRVQVSIDGRRETVYSDASVRAHLDFYANRDNLALLDRLRPDLVWLRRDLPVVPSLDARGWRRVFDGPRSVVFRPPGADASVEGGAEGPPQRGEPSQGPSCFPG